MKLLAVLLIGQFMALLDTFVVNVAMPVIAVDLHASGATLQLVVGGYIAAYAMLLITGARLGDLYGRRRMYLIGVITFTVASLLCGLAPTSAALVAFRCLQGAAAAVLVPQIMSTIQLHFTGAARARALPAYGVVLAVGAVAGLLVGGVLAGTGWRPVFLVNVPIGIALALVVPRAVPADGPRGNRRLDLPGLAVAVPAVLLVVLPLVLGRELGWPVWAFACLAAGLLLAAGFVAVERRATDPLLDLAVLRVSGVGAGILTLACMQLAVGGLLFSLTLHLQADLGYSPLRTGLAYLPLNVIFGLVGILWRRLPAAVHPVVAPAGLALVAAGLLLLSYGPLLPAMAVVGVGMGLSASPLLTQSLVRVTPAQAPDASGLFTTTMQLSQVVGVAVFGTLFLSLHGSADALPVTADWMALLSLAGVVSGVFLTRTVRAARPLAGQLVGQ
ncbi:MAG: MFS transporter [Nonomuraea sp.]|nr:MFS transporter [Nonomuraea sp.]